MIGLPNGSGLFPQETVLALLQLKKPCPCMVSIVERQRIDKARNAIVRNALAANCTHLLFIDDDNPPDQNCIELMIADDKDIVCAPILARNPDADGNYRLCCFHRNSSQEAGGLTLYDNIKKLDTSAGELVKIDACGMGCTMIKRHVLEALVQKYEGNPFEFGDVKVVTDPNQANNPRRTTSEDVEFSERAVKEGFEIWVDCRLQVPHLSAPRLIKFSDNFIL